MRRTTRPRRGAQQDSHQLAAVSGVIALLVIIAFAFNFVGFGGSEREVRATFASANGLKKGSEVRIAGIKIGQVGKLDAGPRNTTTIRIELTDSAPKIHANATMRIKPRLLLEGNFYIDVDPGTAAAPELDSASALPVARTSIPVQLDQVLGTFDQPTRGSMHRAIKGIGRGLGGSPSGAQGLQEAVREFDAQLEDITVAARSVRGVRPGDLPATISDSSEFAEQLANDPRALADLVTNTRTVMSALADNDQALAAGFSELDGVVREAPMTFRALDKALPQTTRFAKALTPALEAAPSPLRKTNRSLDQVNALTRTGSLPTLLAELRPTTSNLPALQEQLTKAAPLLDAASSCLDRNVAWTLNQKLQDGVHTTDDPVYLDLAHGFAGASSSLGGFDGNGVGFRAGIAGGGSALAGIIPGLETVGSSGADAIGVRPQWLGYGVEPAYRPDKWCATQERPDLSKRSGGASPVARAKGKG